MREIKINPKNCLAIKESKISEKQKGKQKEALFVCFASNSLLNFYK